jgi:Lar family restriction alleviation protein
MRLEKSCPFCGSDDAYVQFWRNDNNMKYVVVCQRCGARGPSCKSRHDAEDAWQVRTPKQIWQKLGNGWLP